MTEEEEENLPPVPDEVLAEAHSAWHRARVFQSIQEAIRITERDQRSLSRFSEVIRKAYWAMDSSARSLIDPMPIEIYQRLIFNADGTYTDPEFDHANWAESEPLKSLVAGINRGLGGLKDDLEDLNRDEGEAQEDLNWAEDEADTTIETATDANVESLQKKSFRKGPGRPSKSKDHVNYFALRAFARPIRRYLRDIAGLGWYATNKDGRGVGIEPGYSVAEKLLRRHAQAVDDRITREHVKHILKKRI